jgi:hypothetical protein
MLRSSLRRLNWGRIAQVVWRCRCSDSLGSQFTDLASRPVCKFAIINASRSTFINPLRGVWSEGVPLDLVTAQFFELPANTDNPVSSVLRRLFFSLLQRWNSALHCPPCGKQCFKGFGSSASKGTDHKQLNRSNLDSQRDKMSALTHDEVTVCVPS